MILESGIMDGPHLRKSTGSPAFFSPSGHAQHTFLANFCFSPAPHGDPVWQTCHGWAQLTQHNKQYDKKVLLITRVHYFDFLCRISQTHLLGLQFDYSPPLA